MTFLVKMVSSMLVLLIFVFPLLLGNSGAQFTRCNGGAECLQLQSCGGLYAQLQEGATAALTKLLRSLHCGFENDVPKICCPPQFRVQTNIVTPQTTQQESRGSAASSGNLLPDYNTCGIQYRNRIVGGTETDIDEYPWMALIRYDKPRGWGFYCGGVLISQRYVLTAAHCVKGQGLPANWRLTQVRLGEWDTKTNPDCNTEYCAEPPIDVDVEETIVHEGYSAVDEHQHNDIALLRLARPVKYTDYIQPVCLPTLSTLRTNSFEGSKPDVVGWGKTETRSESDVKLKVSVPVVSNSECANVYGNVGRRIVSKQLCAGGEAGQDSCRGDSGGPLMVETGALKNWVVIGVVSYGPSPCGTVGWPGVYTRVGSYMDWITSKLRP